MFYRNLFLAVGCLCLLFTFASRHITGISLMSDSPATVPLWYLMGAGTILLIGAALADLWTRSAETLRSLQGEVKRLSESVQRVTGAAQAPAAEATTQQEVVAVNLNENEQEKPVG